MIIPNLKSFLIIKFVTVDNGEFYVYFFRKKIYKITKTK